MTHRHTDPTRPLHAFAGATRLDEEKEEGEDKESGPGALLKQLLDSRCVMLHGPVTDDMSRKVMAQLLVLDGMDAEKPIRCFINSPGGSVDAGFAIYDAMRFVRAPIYTICAGLAASAATLILLGAPKEHRYTLPNARFLLHQPSHGIRGQAVDVAIGARETLRIRQRANELYAAETGKDVKQIAEDTSRDFWMDSAAALEYGLVTKIITSASELE